MTEKQTNITDFYTITADESDERLQSVGINFEKYGHYLENSNLTEGEKRELLAGLFHILLNFVDLGFGIHPLQQASKQDEAFEKFLTRDLESMVSSDESSKI